jgi:acetyl-CoA carboxylase carboxyl transferase subunit alpha
MLQYSTYFVISPEGCANIIWKSSEFAPQAASAMGVTSSTLEDLDIVDATIREPMGGAHRDPVEMARRVKAHLVEQVDRLCSVETDVMLEARYQRLMSYGN